MNLSRCSLKEVKLTGGGGGGGGTCKGVSVCLVSFFPLSISFSLFCGKEVFVNLNTTRLFHLILTHETWHVYTT